MFDWLSNLWTRQKPQGAGLRIPSSGSTAGEVVTHKTANTVSAYYAAIKNVSEDMGKIPCHVLSEDSEGNTELAKDLPIYNILMKRPNSMMTALTFKELLNSWAQGWGNGFAEIEFDARMNVTNLWPIHPARVQPYISDEAELFYYVYPDFDIRGGEVNQLGQPIILADWQMFHIKGPTEFGVWGKSVLETMAESIGLTIATQKYGASFFGNGTQSGGVLKHSANLSEEAATRLAESVKRNHQGAGKANKIMVLEEGMEFESTTVNPKDAQALELRQFQVQEIARWFRIQPHKLQDLSQSAYGANLEAQNLDYVTDTLLTWATRWQQEIDSKLILVDGYKSDFDFKFLLKGDRAGRASYYNTMHFMGAMNVNQIRKAEGMNSIGERGDEYYQQSAMVPLGQANGGQESPVQSSPPQSGGDEKAFASIITGAFDRVAAKEQKAYANEAKKDRDHGEWLESFNADQLQFAMSAIMPVITTMNDLGILNGSDTINALYNELKECYTSRTTLDAFQTSDLMALYNASKR
jgi:HK97 family phage portal protein